MNANFRRVVWHIGHGAGPSVNSLSMQDSHLQRYRYSACSFPVRLESMGEHFVIA